MSGVTALGTTFNLPNYVGELFALTPEDTPLLSMIGGLTGGKETTATLFQWQTYDLRDAGQNVALEGADAPTAQNRVRANVFNVTEIHQETIAVSYSKLIASGQFQNTGSAHPYADGLAGGNPVANEFDWQLVQGLKQVARDLEYSFTRGTFQEPSNNSTARQTRGISPAITTNVVEASNAVLTADMLLDAMQLAYDSGGLSESETRTIMVNSLQKRRLSEIFITGTSYGTRQEASRNVGGVNVQTIETDFGICNVVLSRFVPTDEVLILSVEQLAPVFGVVPGKGHVFAEPLAKTGATERSQIYCEAGLEYGAEIAHAKVANLNTHASS